MYGLNIQRTRELELKDWAEPQTLGVSIKGIGTSLTLVSFGSSDLY